MTHDFKAALGAVIAGHDTQVEYPNSINRLTLDELKAIIAALRIADKLMQEPSEGMALEVCNIYERTDTEAKVMAEQAKNDFKAMRDQMIKEIDQ